MKNHLRYSAVSVIAASLAFTGSAAQAQEDPAKPHDDAAYTQEEDTAMLETEAAEALDRCATIKESCGQQVEAAAGVLVFPDVLKANLIVGGAGGRGVMLVDGEVQGHYNIGEASVGLQAGIDQMSMVYVFRDEETLANFTDSGEWEVGAAAGLTVVEADTDASAISGDPVLYTFDASGLNAELEVSALRIWKADGEEGEDAADDGGIGE